MAVWFCFLSLYLMCLNSSESIIMFEKKRYSVKEPKNAMDVKVVNVNVIRKGDISKLAVVRVHTKDGSAKSGTDYFGISKGIW